jgi:hypothetical protein
MVHARLLGHYLKTKLANHGLEEVQAKGTENIFNK